MATVYTPKLYKPSDETLIAIIESYHFGTLVFPSSVLSEVRTVRTPFILEGNTLYCHVAAQNPIWRTIDEKAKSGDGAPVVCLFDGPHHYISPLWYKSERDEPGTRVPTWHYSSVTVKGHATVVTDTAKKIEFLGQLAHKNEEPRAKLERDQEWSLQYMTHERVLKKIEGITVLAINITEIEGALKMGNNGSAVDREYAANALAKIGTDEALATSFLTRNCATKRPVQDWQEELDKLARKRRLQAEEQAVTLGWKEITLVAAVVAVSVAVGRLFVRRL